MPTINGTYVADAADVDSGDTAWMMLCLGLVLLVRSVAAAGAFRAILRSTPRASARGAGPLPRVAPDRSRAQRAPRTDRTHRRHC